MTLLISNAEFEQLVTVEDAIAILEPTFADLGGGRVANRPRTLNYTHLGGDKFYLYSCMDSSVPRLGVHLFRMTSDQIEERIDDDRPRRIKNRNPQGKYCGLVVMFSIEDFAPIAILQDSILNKTMIGATSAIAAKHLSRADSEIMALLGAGWLATTQVIGHCAVRPVKEIRVYSPTEENKRRLCRELSERVSARLLPVNSAEDAMAGADIIACATNSYTPVFSGAWLVPGQHVGSVQIGELDVLTHERATTITSRAREPASVFIKKWVAPIRVLMVPNGCSTVSRRWRIFSGCSSSRRCTASRTGSCSHRVIRRSLPAVDVCLMAQLWQALVK